jgi:4-hydroxybenzoate polyprenyltransferase
VEQAVALARDIKLSHTLFALPWALLAMFMAGTTRPFGLPAAGQIGLILLCMVLSRTYAMACNRLLDARLDALNPRTLRRAVPSGRVTRSFVLTVIALTAIGFIAATGGFWMFYDNPLPLVLSVPVLALLGAYPLLKRISWMCHLYLGLALAIAPLCAWVAIAGLPPAWLLLMAGAVLTWTAGFDIIYACQDVQSDRSTGVFSIPARFGVARALWISRALHAMCVAMLISLGYAAPMLGAFYFAGVAGAIVLLVVEQSLVWPGDLSRVGMAFFTINGIISLAIGIAGFVDVMRFIGI